jgi:hypothetical protein
MTTLTEMRKLSNTKTTIRVVTIKESLIRPFCTNPSNIDEYAQRPKTPKPLLIRAVEHLGTHVANRYEETRNHHGQQFITNNMISNYMQLYEDPTINVSVWKKTGN